MMRALRVCLAVSLALLATAAGCGGASGEEAGDPIAARSEPCSDLPHRGTRVLGDMFFGGEARPGWEQGDEIQRSRYGGRWFSKLGLYVRGEDPIELRVRLGIPVRIKGWSAKRRTRLVSIDPSNDGCDGRSWRGYPGGFLFSGRRCLMLRVGVRDVLDKAPFGLGRACPKRGRGTESG